MKVLVNITSDRKDLVKAGNATTGFKDVIGNVLKLTGILVFEKDEVNDKTGEIETKTVTAIKTADGEFITSISPTVKNSTELIASTYTEDEIKDGIEVMVHSKKSNGGRDFLYLDLV